LLAQATAFYARLFVSAAAVKAIQIHAGLECGILRGNKKDLDILSFGPTIRGARSPRERLQIDTVEPFWLFLRELLAAL
jgi:dipeptidase D